MSDRGPLKVIFLDIDGVLCPPKSYANCVGSHAAPQPECIEALNAILEATGARLVISSSWRLEGIMFMREWLRQYGVTAHVLGCTEWPPLETRGEEIGNWLSECPRDMVDYAVLDDDEAGMDLVAHRLVQVQGHRGLCMDDAARAIAMLAVPSEVSR